MNALFDVEQRDSSSALTFSLLRQLSDGEFHSGEFLARQMGISRSSVNKALSNTSRYGLTLHSVRGRGYRLAHPLQWLDAASVTKYLGPASKHFNVDILDCADSSNTLLMKRAARGAPSGTVLAVEWQSLGRGRMGRSWHSGLGSALTFSVLWRFDCGLAKLSGLSLAFGVALTNALQTFGARDISLKWPNDLLGPTGKLGGILVEAQGDMLGPSTIVAGIGLNLTLQKHLAQYIDQPVNFLANLIADMPERNHLLAAILLEFYQMLDKFCSSGFAALRPDWEKHHCAHGKSVRLLQPNGNYVEGLARGVTDDGSLILETAQGIHTFNAGEISLRTV